MLGVAVNAVAIIIGSLLGLVFKKGISKRFSDAVMTGVALCILCIGVTGMLKGENILVALFSLVIGSIIGTAIDLDRLFNKLGSFAESKFKKNDGKTSIAEGVITASLLFCVGAMAILGSLEAGLKGDYTTLFTKGVIDGVCAIMLTASLGIGVIFSAVFVFVYQGSIALLASLLVPVLNDAAIAELSCVGSLLIFALSLNMLGITKIKVANYIPAVLLAPFVSFVYEAASKLIG